jgi:hypothetical protein
VQHIKLDICISPTQPYEGFSMWQNSDHNLLSNAEVTVAAAIMLLGDKSFRLSTKLAYTMSIIYFFFIRAIPLCYTSMVYINPLNTKLNPISHLLALLAHHILHVSWIRVNTILNTAIYNHSTGVYIKSWQHVSVVHSTIIRP